MIKDCFIYICICVSVFIYFFNYGFYDLNNITSNRYEKDKEIVKFTTI